MKRAARFACMILVATLPGALVAYAQWDTPHQEAPAALPYTALYLAGGTSNFTLSTTNQFATFADLTITFNLPATSAVEIGYHIAGDFGAVPINSAHIVTTVAIDGVEQPALRAISGNHQFYSNDARWGMGLAAGSHTVTVRYRTPGGGVNNPAGNDYSTRKLFVGVF